MDERIMIMILEWVEVDWNKTNDFRAYLMLLILS